ncbi:pseudouridine 5'-phosphatase [Aureococcus anophagefferens]|uniref:Pseudouridine 5'-phosphatase n=1 Tax=Aureococcus anophagefferens TaxID=44056 RepID=A0ABR1FGX9_AURAN
MCLGATAKTGTPPRAVLFDFDGSLAQSEEAHRKRFVAACGVECDVDRWMDHCVGHSTEWIVDYLTGACEPGGARRPPRARDVRGVLRRRRAHGRRARAPGGARRRRRALRHRLVGPRAYIEGCLWRWGLEVAFVVAGDDAEPAEHKPSPEPYLYAAAKLGVDPLDCVCVEDSPSGIEAAGRWHPLT